MKWAVEFSGKVKKQRSKLSQPVVDAFAALVREMEQDGPTRVDWPNYGKLKGKNNCHHCHLNKGRPRYVVVWQVMDTKIRIIEVKYVGTHEGADYGRIC